MIDFVSTRAGVSQQTAACARLLTAVIASAIADAAKPATTQEKVHAAYVDFEARAALDFLFGEDSVFPMYATLIGCDADCIRQALQQGVDSDIPAISRNFGAMSRRVIQARLRRRALLLAAEATAQAVAA